MLSAVLLLVNTLLFSLRLSGGGSFPRPLSAAEEREYLQKYAQGDPEARDALIRHNLRLVAHIVKKYYTQSGDQEDLISIGTIGLIKGISSFNPEKGARLATYAARCIENAILSPAHRPLGLSCSRQDRQGLKKIPGTSVYPEVPGFFMNRPGGRVEIPGWPPPSAPAVPEWKSPQGDPPAVARSCRIGRDCPPGSPPRFPCSPADPPHSGSGSRKW